MAPLPYSMLIRFVSFKSTTQASPRQQWIGDNPIRNLSSKHVAVIFQTNKNVPQNMKTPKKNANKKNLCIGADINHGK